MKHNIRCCILDWAGTTVDFGCFAPVAAFHSVFQRRGIDITTDQIRHFMGTDKKEHIRKLCFLPDIAEQWKWLYGSAPGEDDIHILYREFQPTLISLITRYAELIPEVQETVSALQKKGIAIGSTTGYTRVIMDILAPRAAAQGYTPDCLVTSTEVPRGRPAPWMIYRNCEHLNIWPPSSVLKVGDTTVDIASGIHAGAWTVGIIAGSSELGLSRTELAALSFTKREKMFSSVRDRFYTAGAHFVIDTFSELPKILHRITEEMEIRQSVQL
ncbi:MAG: phosphonoacetaldehyde hydrolase [Fibrobacterota bacterium]